MDNEWKAYQSQVEKLSAEYQEACENLWTHSDFTGLNLMPILDGILGLLAIELLLESDLPVLEIAKSIGYCGDGHFHQAFKEIYGTTPAKFRKTLPYNTV